MTVKEFLKQYEPTKAKFFGKELQNFDKEDLLRFISWHEEYTKEEIKRINKMKNFQNEINFLKLN